MEVIQTSKYSNGKIYKIKSNQTEKFYIGSTINELKKRLIEHKSLYKCFQEGKGNFVASFEIIIFNDVSIELIEKFSCNSKKELVKREGEIIKQYLQDGNILNKNIAGRTFKEYYEQNSEKLKNNYKQYYNQNKEKVREQQNNYYLANREKISKRRKAKRDQKKKDENKEVQ